MKTSFVLSRTGALAFCNTQNENTHISPMVVRINKIDKITRFVMIHRHLVSAKKEICERVYEGEKSTFLEGWRSARRRD